MSGFFFPDTSPIFSYSPCSNCGDPDSWQSAYSPRGDGYDVTFHQSPSASSAIQFNVSASSLEVRTGAIESCDASIQINGTEVGSTCSVANLPGGIHQVTIKPAHEDGNFQFYGAAGKGWGGDDKKNVNGTIDDISSSFTYSPGWTSMTPNGPVAGPANTSIPALFADMNGFANRTASVTAQVGASASLMFKGSAIYLYGMTGPEGGTAEVIFDGAVTHSLNLTSPWKAYSSLMFFQTGLNASETHNLSVVSTGPQGGQVVLDYALLSTPMKGSSGITPRLVMLIGIISGVSALLLLCGVVLYLFLSQRRDRRRAMGGAGGGGKPPMRSYGFTKGISYLDNTKSYKIDSWRKNAALDTPTTPYTGSDPSPRPVPTSGSHSASSGSRFVHAQQQQLSQPTHPGSGQSPPPDYPDYLPYTGPYESRPPSVYDDHDDLQGDTYSQPRNSLTSLNPPPGIVGFNPSAQTWLSTTSGITPSPGYSTANTSMRHLVGNSNQAYTSSQDRSPRQERAARRPDPIPLKNRSSVHRDNVLSPEGYNHHRDDRDSYATSAQLDLVSPVSTLSSIGVTRVPSRATRSVARLWPSRDAVPSLMMRNSVFDHRSSKGLELSLGSSFSASVHAAAGSDVDRARHLVDSRVSTSHRSPVDSTHFERHYGGLDRGYAPQSHGASPGTNDTSPSFGSATMDSMKSTGYTKSSPSSAYRSTKADVPQSIYHHSTTFSTSTPTVSSPSSPYGLRRGVSIKSVKTMRSFFSGLLFNPPLPNETVPPTPAVRHQIAARPDSDIFPIDIGTVHRSNSLMSQFKSASQSQSSPSSRRPAQSIASHSPSQSPRRVDLPMVQPGAGGVPHPPAAPQTGTSQISTASHQLPTPDHLFIELNPYSPISRPGSEMTPGSWRF